MLIEIFLTFTLSASVKNDKHALSSVCQVRSAPWPHFVKQLLGFRIITTVLVIFSCV